jgi:histidinol-phosphate aminotransferase
MENKFDIKSLLRENILTLKPYSSARDEYTGEASVFLDANENPFNEPYNRYPDPLQRELKEKISKLKNTSPENIFLGNGSDEAIDLLIRAFCSPGEDNIVTISPTYGMYRVAADINDISVTEVLLNPDFSLSADAVIKAVNSNTKLIFLCSPNNPTGNILEKGEIEKIINSFNGIVVIDEAYIDFCPEESMLKEPVNYPNMVIIQTFSKAWGMAGIRLGMAFGTKELINVLNLIKYPYNLNILTQQKALELIDLNSEKDDWVKTIVEEREKMEKELNALPFVEIVFPSDSNFLLVKTADPIGIYNYLTDEKIIVRDRSGVSLCEGCLRISIGNKEENETLMNTLKSLI